MLKLLEYLNTFLQALQLYVGNFSWLGFHQISIGLLYPSLLIKMVRFPSSVMINNSFKNVFKV